MANSSGDYTSLTDVRLSISDTGLSTPEVEAILSTYRLDKDSPNSSNYPGYTGGNNNYSSCVATPKLPLAPQRPTGSSRPSAEMPPPMASTSSASNCDLTTVQFLEEYGVPVQERAVGE